MKTYWRLFCAIWMAWFLPVALAAASHQETEALRLWKAGTVVSREVVEAYGIDRCFAADRISDGVFRRMKGKSYKTGCTVPRSQLRYIRTLHYDGEGCIRLGEMVCNVRISRALVDIFRALYQARYPIERMLLIDEYDADDEASMRANNSSCFNYRVKTTGTSLSKHAQGMAVDINPLYNPYVRRISSDSLYVAPAAGRAYAVRRAAFPYKIVRTDRCCEEFAKRGFRWGGAWKNSKDYQHFEK